MTDQWPDRLSEYLDGDLTEAERDELTRHLAQCASCTALLADLERVKAVAAALPHVPPAADLWPAIAAGISRSNTVAFPRCYAFSVFQLAAAAALLAMLSAGAAWLTGRDPARRDLGTALPPASGVVTATSRPSRGSSHPSYDSAVAELSGVLAEGRERLDTATVRVLDQSLQAIDRAIAEGQRAVEADPASVYLNNHLSRTRRQKLDLLRRAATLAQSAS